MKSTQVRAAFIRVNAEWAARLIADAGRGSQDLVKTVGVLRGQRVGAMAAVEDGVEESRSAEVHGVEVARRAGAIAHGEVRERGALGLSDELARQIESAERRARSLAAAGGRCEESR